MVHSFRTILGAGHRRYPDRIHYNVRGRLQAPPRELSD
jgi:hypothetical protein